MDPFSIIVVSVVRDKAMFADCLGKNPVMARTTIRFCDNTVENRPIPWHYNQAIEEILAEGRPCWIAFLHEDFMPLEPLEEVLADADPDTLWGPIGGTTKRIFGVPYKGYICGAIQECRKDGSDQWVIGHACARGTPAEAFDCCCFFAHSSLFAKHPTLRFDERCAFDMYVEDLCFQAEYLKIPKRILPLQCLHKSYGNPNSERFLQILHYCRQKHQTLHISGGTCTPILTPNFLSNLYSSWRFIKKQKFNPFRILHNWDQHIH